MPFKQVEETKTDSKKPSQNPKADRPRVIPYRWHDDEDGSKTVPPGRSKRVKGEWMKR